MSETVTGRRARLIAFYLPQFHPIPENDEWWGKGFTEWTNVTKAKPLFKGHYQPHLPADLGFYDLRVPEVRAAQAALARAHGVEAFCYWHYWFAGKRLLERPFQEVLESGKPDFPFCLGWANESWTGIWHGNPKRTLIEQTYPGEDDHKRHFDFLLSAFMDPRYVRVKGKPLFFIYKPALLPDSQRVFELWRNLARRAGLSGLYLVCQTAPGEVPAVYDPAELGFDAFSCDPVITSTACWPVPPETRLRRLTDGKRGIGRLGRWLYPEPLRAFRYKDAIRHMILNPDSESVYHPIALPNWDNSPRSGGRSLVLHGASPSLFRVHLRQVLSQVSDREPDTRIVFLKSWNEWAEGNYLEPDQQFGCGFLEAIRDEVGAPSPS